MFSTYQKRLKNALGELPVRLKFKAMVNSRNDNQLCNSIMRDARPTEIEELKALSETYFDLTLNYNQKEKWELWLEAIEAREKLQEAVDSSGKLIRACLYFVGVIEKLNKVDIDNPYIQKFCDRWKLLLKETQSANTRASQIVVNTVKGKNNVIDLLDRLEAEIKQKEDYLGFTHPFSNEF